MIDPRASITPVTQVIDPHASISPVTQVIDPRASISPVTQLRSARAPVLAWPASVLFLRRGQSARIQACGLSTSVAVTQPSHCGGSSHRQRQ